MTFKDYCIIDGKKHVIIDSGLICKLMRESEAIAIGSYHNCKDKLYQIKEAKQ